VVQFFTDEVHAVLGELIMQAQGDSARVVNHVMDEAEDLVDELERETPFDPEGPNDPPLHAAESWRMKVNSKNNKVLVSISNPKYYIGWLEERGGRSDHPGANDPGWMDAAFNNFILGLRGGL
jgi:hypothetical protein